MYDTKLYDMIRISEPRFAGSQKLVLVLLSYFSKRHILFFASEISSTLVNNVCFFPFTCSSVTWQPGTLRRASKVVVPQISTDLHLDYEIEYKFHFAFSCSLHKCISKRLFDDINVKYPNFNTLSNPDKILFLFNIIDPFIYKKLGYFTFEAYQKTKQ